MFHNFSHIILICLVIFISWNEIAGQNVKRSGVKGKPRNVGYNAKRFLRNYFRTVCNRYEEETPCQVMEGGTCWEPEYGFSNYPCREGCNCREGYLRNSAGSCVLKKYCHTKSKPKNYVEPLTVLMKNKVRNVPRGVRPP